MSSRLESIPEETPRRVRPSAYLSSAGGALLLTGALWLAIGAGIALGLNEAPDAWDDLLVTVRGSAAKGRALAVVPTDSVLRKRRVEEIRFEFKDRAGNLHRARSRTSDPGILKRARLGAEMPVHYDRARPTRARIDGTRLSPFGVFIVFPAVLGVAGVALSAWGLALVAARRRLLVHGTLATGRVVESLVSESAFRRRRAYDVRYAFDGPGGELEGVAAEEEAPRAGTEIAVLFDPERPWRNAPAHARAFAR